MQSFFYKAQNIDQLKEFLKELKKKNIKVTILGVGSNTLFRDKGVKGVVIKLEKIFPLLK